MNELVWLLTLLVASIAAAPNPRFGFDSGRVVGGEEATPHQFPHMVSLQTSLGLVSQHSCGGSIISERFILTAAHCVGSILPIKVVAGKHSLKTKESTEQSVSVQKRIVHPKYSGGVGPYDIALLKLKKSLVFNDAVQPIALPPADEIPAGQARLSGWGSTSTGWLPKYPDKLRTVLKPLLEYSECEAALGESPLHPSNLCTGPLSGGISACSGDSGGPLITDSETPQVIGIVSWGYIPCGTRGQPSVYTRVSAYIDWIGENMS